MLRVVGLSFRSAPVELRERVVVGEAELDASLRTLGRGVILSTCNRTEVYQSLEADESYRDAIDFFRERFAGPSDALSPFLYRIEDGRAVRHLYAVAAGLDSMVLGEPQILGQVRAAIDAAEAAKTADPILSRAFRQAVRVGRRARAETFVGRHAVSISYAAVELARSVFGTLHGCRALVVGAGAMGELTARTLVDHGVGVIAVANRTVDNAQALANRFGGEAVALENLATAIASADIVITSTDAPSPVIGPPDIHRALLRRGSRPLFLIDIAVPRDVDPAVRSFPNVFLYDIDDLKSLCDLNREGRRQEIARVQQIIDDEARRFETWWRTRRAVPTLAALRDLGERVREEELAEALSKLRHLDAADRATVDALTRAIVARLLHHPRIRLKEMADRGDAEQIRLVRDLFGLDSESV